MARTECLTYSLLHASHHGAEDAGTGCALYAAPRGHDSRQRDARYLPVTQATPLGRKGQAHHDFEPRATSVQVGSPPFRLGVTRQTAE